MTLEHLRKIIKEEILKESKSETRIPLDLAKKIAHEISSKLKLISINPNDIFQNTEGRSRWCVPVGSIRRQENDIGDIDLVVTSPISVDYIKENLENIKNVKTGEKQIFFDYHSEKFDTAISINIWICTDMRSFGAMVLHATGPGNYNAILRSLAKKNGLKLNQYGLWKNDRWLVGRTEGEIYKGIKTNNYPDGLNWKSPNLRGIKNK